MSKLFLFSLIEFFSQISLDIIVLIANSIIVIICMVCLILSLVKVGYSVKDRLWILPLMVGVWFIQLWIELSVNGKVRGLFLTVGLSLWLLSLIVFLPPKNNKITQPQREFARLISNKVKAEKEEKFANVVAEKSAVFSSPIIKTEPRNNTINNQKTTKSEIDFSHVKSVLNKLEYYPLKEQDKKQAKELENAINNAEQNGINVELKEKINDGLGALLKIMSKYAI